MMAHLTGMESRDEFLDFLKKEEELLACPFCGRVPVVRLRDERDCRFAELGFRTVWVVACACGAGFEHGDYDVARQMWNRRPPR